MTITEIKDPRTAKVFTLEPGIPFRVHNLPELYTRVEETRKGHPVTPGHVLVIGLADWKTGEINDAMTVTVIDRVGVNS